MKSFRKVLRSRCKDPPAILIPRWYPIRGTPDAQMGPAYNINTLTPPSLLHLLPKLGLGLLISHAQLLEEDIRRVEHTTRVASHDTFLSQKVIHGLRTGLLLPIRIRRFSDIAYQARLGDHGITHMIPDLAPDLITRIVNRNLQVLLPRQRHRRHIVLSLILYSRRLLDLLPWRLEPLQLALFEETCRVEIRQRRGALVATLLPHKVQVRARRHVNGILELANFHLAIADESIDLATDLVAVVVGPVEAFVFAVDFGDILLLWLRRFLINVGIVAGDFCGFSFGHFVLSSG